jgi:hypothetical protein
MPPAVPDANPVSPKALNAGVAALLAPLAARAIAGLFGIELEAEWLEGLILAAIAGGAGLVAAYRSRDAIRDAGLKAELEERARRGVSGAPGAGDVGRLP